MVALGARENVLPPLSLIWFSSRSEIKATAARNQQKQDSGHENISPENWQKPLGGLHIVTVMLGFAHPPSQSLGVEMAVGDWVTALGQTFTPFPARILKLWSLATHISSMGSIWKLARIQFFCVKIFH